MMNETTKVLVIGLDIDYNQGLKRFVNAMIHFIEDGHYEKTGWESTELKKLLPTLKSLKQKPL